MKKIKRLFHYTKFLSIGYKLLLLSITIALTAIIYTAIAAPPSSKYTAGETLEPNCSPGDINCTVASSGSNETITLSGDASGSGTTGIAVTISDNAIEESMLKAVDTASDEDILTYEATTGDFEWHSSANLGIGTATSITDSLIIAPDLNADVDPVDGDFLQYDSTGTNFTWRSSSETLSDLGISGLGSNFSSSTNDLLSDNGSIVLGGTDGSNNEKLSLDFETSSNSIDWTSSTGVVAWDLSDFDITYKAVSIEAGALVADSVDGDDINSNIAGRSLTLTSASPDTLDADAELYTDTKCIYFEDPTADDDFKSIWANKTAGDYTLTEIWCESDQTVNLDLQIDDGSPADVNGGDLACTTSEAEDTSLSGDTTLAAGEELDLAITSVSGTPTWVSICWTYTKND